MSLDLKDCPRLQGFMCLKDLKATSMRDLCWEVQQCLQFVAGFENVQVISWIGFSIFGTFERNTRLACKSVTYRTLLLYVRTPCRLCVCWWFCLPCWSCWEFRKTTRVGMGTTASLVYRSLTGANGHLRMLDLTKFTRLWGGRTTNQTNVPTTFTVSAKSVIQNIMTHSFDHLFWFSWVVVQALKPCNVLWSRDTFDPIVPCILLALVLKPLCGLGCRHCSASMSFVGCAGLMKVAREGKERTEPHSWIPVIATCEYCRFIPLLFPYIHKMGLKRKWNTKGFDATWKYKNYSVSPILTHQTREAWKQENIKTSKTSKHKIILQFNINNNY